jgi:nucleotide-binding universal stress UspA family protein
MFSRILVATDFSEASERVICALGNLRLLGTREAILVHCLNIRDVGTLANRLKELIKPSIEKQRSFLESQGFQTSIEVVLGLPHIEINRIAAEKDCSLIVLGSFGYTMLGEAFLGGVANAVIHTATKPVLLLRLKTREDEGRVVCEEATCDPLEHVLFPTDFSDNAERAFAYVEKVVECGAKRVTVLHVQDETKIGKHLAHRLEEFNATDTARMERLKDQLENTGATDVRIALTYGSPTSEILEHARENGVSFVIMGSQGRGFVREVLLGSVSHSVARLSRVPVLLVPALRGERDP